MNSSVAKHGLCVCVYERVVFVSPNGFVGEGTFPFAICHVIFNGLWSRRVHFVFETPYGVAVRGLVQDVVFPINEVVVVDRRDPCPFNVGVSIHVFPAFLRGRGDYQVVFSKRVHGLARANDASAVLPIQRLRFVVGLGYRQFFDGQRTALRRLLQVLDALGEFVRHPYGGEAYHRRDSVGGPRRFRAFRTYVRAYAVPFSPFFQRGEHVYFYGSHCLYRCVQDAPQ